MAEAEAGTDWQDAEDRLLAAVPDGAAVRRPALLDRPAARRPRAAGLAPARWSATRPLARPLPDELVEVYLTDDEAEPLHDCAECGLPVPVRAGRRGGHEPTCERVVLPGLPALRRPDRAARLLVPPRRGRRAPN